MEHSVRNKLLIIIPVLFFFSSPSRAQSSFDKSFYGGLFYITGYMTTQEYLSFKHSHTDSETVDHIYEKALKFFDGDFSETFFCLTFALIPYNKIDMRLPLTGTRISVPLPSPPNKIFKEKLKNTPKKLFFDSPKNDFGDKDKLAHFFSNAFLRYNVSFFNLSQFLGIFVEYFEQGFFLQGGYDERDLIVNHLGEFFAVMVKNNPDSKPSEALKIYQLLKLRLF